jgi:hypothetical protein
MLAGPASRPWRRYLRLNVRGLIVLVLVIGAGLGWIVRQAHVQRDAVAAITRAGGSVMYDWEWRDAYHTPGGKPWAPRWLADLVGVDYFGHVTYVSLNSSSTATDASIAQLGLLSRLQVLDLDKSSVSDAGLAHLTGLTNLSLLDLRGTQVTDSGLAYLKGLTSLSILYLSDTQVTDSGLPHLKALTKLYIVLVDHTQVTDAGMQELSQASPSLLINR